MHNAASQRRRHPSKRLCRGPTTRRSVMPIASPRTSVNTPASPPPSPRREESDTPQASSTSRGASEEPNSKEEAVGYSPPPLTLCTSYSLAVYLPTRSTWSKAACSIGATGDPYVDAPDRRHCTRAPPVSMANTMHRAAPPNDTLKTRPRRNPLAEDFKFDEENEEANRLEGPRPTTVFHERPINRVVYTEAYQLSLAAALPTPFAPRGPQRRLEGTALRVRLMKPPVLNTVPVFKHSAPREPLDENTPRMRGDPVQQRLVGKTPMHGHWGYMASRDPVLESGLLPTRIASPRAAAAPPNAPTSPRSIPVDPSSSSRPQSARVPQRPSTASSASLRPNSSRCATRSTFEADKLVFADLYDQVISAAVKSKAATVESERRRPGSATYRAGLLLRRRPTAAGPNGKESALPPSPRRAHDPPASVHAEEVPASQLLRCAISAHPNYTRQQTLDDVAAMTVAISTAAKFNLNSKKHFQAHLSIGEFVGALDTPHGTFRVDVPSPFEARRFDEGMELERHPRRTKELREQMAAFLHWSWENSGHAYAVEITKIIGSAIVAVNVHTNTEQTEGGERPPFGSLNGGIPILRELCSRHVCGDVCKALNLPPMVVF